MRTPTMSGVITTPLYEDDPMDVVVHKVRWAAPHGTGQVTEFEHPRGDSSDFVNIDVMVDDEAVIGTYSTMNSLCLKFRAAHNGSQTNIWFSIDKVEEVALAILAEAAKYRADVALAEDQS